MTGPQHLNARLGSLINARRRASITFYGILALALILIYTAEVYSANMVYIEFFYFDPSTIPHFCWACPASRDAWEKFRETSSLIDDVQTEYGDQVKIERIDKRTSDGLERCNQYNCTGAQVVVINQTTTLADGQITKENLKKYIDVYLRGEDPNASPAQTVNALLAFSLGLFSGISPCLMAMLAFILSYSSSTASNFRSGMLRVLLFGLGFMSAIMLLGTLVAATLTSIPSLYDALMWAVSIVMILVGLKLIGLVNVPFRSKPLVQKLAQKYRATAIGLFSLGFMFYFVNLCTAPLSFAVLPMLTTAANMYLLTMFGLGVLIPFVAVGILAGGSPALAKRIREQHRRKIRAVSGLILMAYATWLIVFYLL